MLKLILHVAVNESKYHDVAPLTCVQMYCADKSCNEVGFPNSQFDHIHLMGTLDL